MQKKSSTALLDTKPHYDLLDGLRGVAAVLVVWYHIFEAFATSPIDQRFNHGYLAVDFFFILSGFVIGYAYDDRDGTPVSMSMVMLAMLMGLFLIPAVPGTGPEVRGNGEMYPLNGPSWSLFFEYIGNILYALFLRRLPTKVLTVLVGLAGIGLASFAIFNFSGYGHLGVGWSMGDYNLIGGFLRLLFSFSIGLLMSLFCFPCLILAMVSPLG